MAPETLAEAERLILRGDDLDAVCEVLDCTRRTLERAFVAAHGTTPARWRRAQQPAKPIPPVSFRLHVDLWANLRAAAEAAGVEPNAWAKAAVLRALVGR